MNKKNLTQDKQNIMATIHEQRTLPDDKRLFPSSAKPPVFVRWCPVHAVDIVLHLFSISAKPMAFVQ